MPGLGLGLGLAFSGGSGAAITQVSAATLGALQTAINDTSNNGNILWTGSATPSMGSTIITIARSNVTVDMSSATPAGVPSNFAGGGFRMFVIGTTLTAPEYVPGDPQSHVTGVITAGSSTTVTMPSNNLVPIAIGDECELWPGVNWIDPAEPAAKYPVIVTNITDNGADPVSNAPTANYDLASNANDQVGSFNGLAVASPTFTGSQVTLNGSSQYITCGTIFNTPPAAGSIEFWIKWNSVPGSTQRMMTNFNLDDGANYDGLDCYFNPSGPSIVFNMIVSNVNHAITYNSIAPLNDTNWHQVICEWGAAGMSFYIDKVLLGTNAYTGKWGNFDVTNGKPLTFGAFNSVGDGVIQFANAAYKCCRVWPTQLTASQRATLYSGGPYQYASIPSFNGKFVTLSSVGCSFDNIPIYANIGTLQAVITSDLLTKIDDGTPGSYTNNNAWGATSSSGRTNRGNVGVVNDCGLISYVGGRVNKNITLKLAGISETLPNDGGVPGTNWPTSSFAIFVYHALNATVQIGTMNNLSGSGIHTESGFNFTRTGGTLTVTGTGKTFTGVSDYDFGNVFSTYGQDQYNIGDVDVGGTNNSLMDDEVTTGARTIGNVNYHAIIDQSVAGTHVPHIFSAGIGNTFNVGNFTSAHTGDTLTAISSFTTISFNEIIGGANGPNEYFSNAAQNVTSWIMNSITYGPLTTYSHSFPGVGAVTLPSGIWKDIQFKVTTVGSCTSVSDSFGATVLASAPTLNRVYDASVSADWTDGHKYVEMQAGVGAGGYADVLSKLASILTFNGGGATVLMTGHYWPG